MACGPPGLEGGKNILFHNNGDGTFTDVSEKAGIWKTPGPMGWVCWSADFDNDGWPDIYVANDSTSSALYKNNHDGTFTDIAIEAGVAYSADGKPQAGMGVSAADYDCDGNFDIVKTNFAGDTSSLYRNLGDGFFDDQTFQAGLGTQHALSWMGCGVSAISTTTAGPDILLCNGHVYPEVGETATESGYRQRKVAVSESGERQFRGCVADRRSRDSGAGPGRGVRVRRFRQRRRRGCARELRERRAATAALRFDAEEQLDQAQADGHEIEPQRRSERACTARPGQATGRWTRSAAAAATCRRAICGFTSGWARPPRRISRSAGRAASWTGSRS